MGTAAVNRIVSPFNRMYVRSAPYAVTVVLAAAAGGVVASKPTDLRIALAAVLAVSLIGIGLVRPRTAATITLFFLPFLALLRRLLIAPSGWSQTDPLILVGPLVVLALTYRLFVLGRRPLAPDFLSKLVVGLVVLTGAEAVNPAGGSIVAGVGGLLFMAIPLLWFFVGREVSDERLVRTVLSGTLLIAIAIAAYGLWQDQVGMPSWDKAWMNIAGYDALHVGKTALRPFGTFSSNAEYALYLAAGVVIAIAFALHRRSAALVALPLLGVALFLSSVRGALVTSAVAIVLVIALRSRRPKVAITGFILGLALAVGGIVSQGGALQSTASSSSALVSHQLGGITNPLNPNQSTLLIHIQLVEKGFTTGIHKPLGSGTGVTNLAGAKLGGSSGGAAPQGQATEVDISNAFVALGLLGGILYVAIVVTCLVWSIRTYFARRDIALAICGLLVATLGQWLTGGLYALAPLIWFLLGWIAKAMFEENDRRSQHLTAAST